MVWTGGGGLAGDVEFLQERGRMWWGKYVVLCELLDCCVVVMLVDAEVNDELVMRGSKL